MSAVSHAPPPRVIAPAPIAAVGRLRWTLARIEGRRLLTHPLFLFGLATSLAALLLADSDALERSSMLSGDCVVMLGGAIWTFIVAFLATSRERRDAAQDFYAGKPVAARHRTEAALLSVAFAGLAGAALIAIAAIVLAGADGVVVIDAQQHAGQPLPPRSYALQPIELAQGPTYLMTAGVLGVMAGSWTRHVGIGALAALLLFLPPVALLPRLVFELGESAGFYGSVSVNGRSGWDLAAGHLLAMAGLAGLGAAATLLARDNSR